MTTSDLFRNDGGHMVNLGAWIQAKRAQNKERNRHNDPVKDVYFVAQDDLLFELEALVVAAAAPTKEESDGPENS